MEEKHVTLPISKKVAYLLSRDKNIKVIMTRQKDVYVPLLRRAEIAAKSCADAFVSIHADSMPNYPNWDGVTVFKASPRLFEKAESTAKAVARHVKLCSNTMCWSISPLLLNMSTTVTFVESSKLASFVVKSMKAKVNDNLVNGIKNMQRNILVLKTPGRPAILIETGFMTNRLDRHRLFENGYQWKIAKGISRGIRNYLELLNTVALES
ncbi:MAG: hypothetical protein GWP10_07995 [Nitrospiraceae bacterium]|nr:hypothetical protein [Nitrospiraceae bacterium]